MSADHRCLLRRTTMPHAHDACAYSGLKPVILIYHLKCDCLVLNCVPKQKNNIKIADEGEKKTGPRMGCHLSISMWPTSPRCRLRPIRCLVTRALSLLPPQLVCFVCCPLSPLAHSSVRFSSRRLARRGKNKQRAAKLHLQALQKMNKNGGAA